MDRLNYHHLLYFWTVAREGTIAAACRRLHLAQPTISAQLRVLEETLGLRLLERSGRSLTLTDAGRTVFKYADEIFSLGHELMDTLRAREPGAPTRLRVGIADVLPKLVVYRLLQPVWSLTEPVRLACYEGKTPDLLSRLSVHELDVVLADTPIPPHVSVRAFSHRLGQSPVGLYGVPSLVARYRAGFPASLEGAPMLLPTPGTVARRLLDHWLQETGLRPRIVAEFEDSALMKVFGQSGAGLFPAAAVIEPELRQQFGVRPLARLPGAAEQFFAISVERRIRHPAVQALTTAAARSLAATRPARRTPRS